MSAPLCNRVDPFGELFATPARGLLMGNRGGRLHADGQTLTKRRWVSPQWICCRLEFNDRHRAVWGASYTELFFLDEVTALATGHRPCFECRRQDANVFAELWARTRGLPVRALAPDMDKVLQVERLNGHSKRIHRRGIDRLPDGAVIALEGEGAFAVHSGALLHWTPQGYDARRPLPRDSVDVLTPPSILSVLSAGYRPQWHPTAEKLTSSRP
jgi:hypothetical protein